ncbi:sugar ABC transporter permease [Jatrophihabitans telluris]|uniref:Sugar ABC transporter permease n=1 Tax=Jatrophihabitans telluris TaxID=2038343 RepID=A0ABY4R1T5_9ACTN|nr:sugar ABC transporter permease [Jatrophihabitans telluris]UQX89422.1 sugar ABC transporter permease [Jatrophihabitans telluris]
MSVLPGTVAPGPSAKRRRPGRPRLAYLLILPATAVLAAVVGWPLVKIVQLSVQQQLSGKYALFHGGANSPYVGLRNYSRILSDSGFWTVAVRTAVFTAINVGLSLLIGMALALLLNRVSRWARVLLVAVLLFAWAVPSTVSTQVFYWLFSNQYGAVNYLLDALPGVHLAGHDWFADPHQGLAVITAVVVWGAIPLLAISLHAGITQIPREILEAATCDGASPWQAFRSVVLPYLTPLLVILTTLSVIWDFGVFNQIWFMRNGHPEPGYQTLGIYLYANGIGSSHYNDGATIAVLMMLCLLVVMVVYIRQLFRIGDAQ